MPIFYQFGHEEYLVFFAVLVRFVSLTLMMPWLTGRIVPWYLKVLLSLAITTVLFPSLMKSGALSTREVHSWSQSTLGILRVLGLEAFFGILLGYTVRLIFEAVYFGSNLVNSFVGFSSGSVVGLEAGDEKSVLGEFYAALAMLVFLAIDGHHLVLRAAMDSYQWVGMGQVQITGALGERLLEFSGLVFKYGLQLASPVGIAIFAVQVGIGVSSRALPQANIYAWSVSATLLIGLAVMLFTLSDFSGLSSRVFLKSSDWMSEISKAVGNE